MSLKHQNYQRMRHRIGKAYLALAGRGFATAHAVDPLDQGAMERVWRAERAVFYTSSDARMLKTGELWLSWVGDAKDGDRICEALALAGLDAHWDGDPDTGVLARLPPSCRLPLRRAAEERAAAD